MGSQFTKDSVAQFKALFTDVDKNENGNITSDELRVLLEMLGEKGEKGEELTDEEIKAMIAEVDRDGNSTIDFTEFMFLYIKILAKRSKERNHKEARMELKYAFEMFDLDGSGKISKAELGQVLKYFEANLSDQELEEMIEKADADKDGQIDYQEFLKMKYEKSSQSSSADEA